MGCILSGMFVALFDVLTEVQILHPISSHLPHLTFNTAMQR